MSKKSITLYDVYLAGTYHDQISLVVQYHAAGSSTPGTRLDPTEYPDLVVDAVVDSSMVDLSPSLTHFDYTRIENTLYAELGMFV